MTPTKETHRTPAVRGGHTPPERTMDMATKRKSAAGGRTAPPLCSVSLSPLVMRFAADCVESWAKLSRCTPSHRAHPSHEFALFLADHVVSEMRKAYGTPNAGRTFDAPKEVP